MAGTVALSVRTSISGRSRVEIHGREQDSIGRRSWFGLRLRHVRPHRAQQRGAYESGAKHRGNDRGDGAVCY